MPFYNDEAAIDLTRNFGKECALTALDADLQDPPEVIPQLVEKWRDGADALRSDRASDTVAKRGFARMFYHT